MKRATIVVLLFVSILAVSRGAKADDSAFWGNGVNVYPVEEASISMDYELLNIAVTEDKNRGLTARVDVLFVFRNAGPEKTVTLGFPEWGGGNGEEEHFIPTIYDFKAVVDGVQAEAVCQPLKKRNDEFSFERVHLWRVHFKKGQTRTVQNSYWYEASGDSIGNWSIGYILKTGALWAGPIGKIDIFVKAGPPVVDYQDTNGDGVAWNENPIRWMSYVPFPEEYSEFHAVNWEPQYDIQVESNYFLDRALYHRDFSESYGRVTPEDRQKAVHERRALIRSYIADLSEERLSTCSKNELQEYINGIYATYGRVFQTPEWAKFFKAKWWYEPDPSFKDSMLPAQDLKTIVRLQRYVAGALETEEKKP